MSLSERLSIFRETRAPDPKRPGDDGQFERWIDAALGCQQCGARLGGSPSDDFCGALCQEDWHAARAKPLLDYLPSPGSDFVDTGPVVAVETGDYCLFIGGPMHGRWIPVPEAGSTVELPSRSWPSTLDECPDSFVVTNDVYNLRTVAFVNENGQLVKARVFVNASMAEDELLERLGSWVASRVLRRESVGADE